MNIPRVHPGIVAADNTGDPSDSTVDDVVVQGAVGRSKATTQQIVDGFVAETGHYIYRFFRNVHRSSIVVVLDRSSHDLPGHIEGVVVIELKMNGARHFRLRGCGDDLRMITLSHLGQRGHDTLDIHHHYFHCSGRKCQLLLQVGTGYGYAVSHQHLIGRAAHPGQVDPLDALRPGQCKQLLVLSRHNDRLRELRFMAMDNDVDFILFENA